MMYREKIEFLHKLARVFDFLSLVTAVVALFILFSLPVILIICIIYPELISPKLGIAVLSFPVWAILTVVLDALGEYFKEKEGDKMEEKLQFEFRAESAELLSLRRVLERETHPLVRRIIQDKIEELEGAGNGRQ